MRRTETQFTTEEKALMLDLIIDSIENDSKADLKNIPIEYKRESVSAFIGYNIRKALVDNGFMESGNTLVQRRLNV